MAIPTKIKLSPEFEKLPLKTLFIISFVFSAITIVLGLIAQIILPPQIPLFYGLPQSTDQLAPSLFIILPSFVAMIITFINAVVSIRIHDTYLKKTLAFTAISISALAIITTFKIIFIVGSL